MNHIESLSIDQIIADDSLRHHLFPVTAKRLFFAHAGVAPLTGPAGNAIRECVLEGSADHQESGSFLQRVKSARQDIAKLISASPQEISLIGPTALGLNLVALGLTWKEGDEVVYYPDDYPSNVYPWSDLTRLGVKPIPLKPLRPGEITPDLVLSTLTPKTRLVALSSCHFLTGFRVDVETIGLELKRRGILVCLDAIQSLGASEIKAEWVDFISADSHKWMLGPLGAGFFYVAKEHQEKLRPALLGSWNVNSPGFIAQEQVAFPPTGQRYEPGSLNGLGIVGMQASVSLLLNVGIDNIRNRLLSLHDRIAEGLKSKDFHLLANNYPTTNKSGIVTATHPSKDLKKLYQKLDQESATVSVRWNREGTSHLRLSPHFYNTEQEVDRLISLL